MYNYFRCIIVSFSATGPSGCGPITPNPRGSQLTLQGSPIGDPDLGGWPSFSLPHPSSTTFPGSKCSLQSLSSDVTLLSTSSLISLTLNSDGHSCVRGLVAKDQFSVE